jgi:hypothetical protein
LSEKCHTKKAKYQRPETKDQKDQRPRTKDQRPKTKDYRHRNPPQVSRITSESTVKPHDYDMLRIPSDNTVLSSVVVDQDR